MTIPLTGASGLFTRIGHIGGGISDLNTISGQTVDASPRVTGLANQVARVAQLIADYDVSAPLNQPTIDGIYQSLGSLQNQLPSYIRQLANLAQQTVIDMAAADVALPSKDIVTALKVLIQQMSGAAASVNQSVPTLGSQTAGTSPSPNGNPVIVLSEKDGQGLVLQYVFPETMTFTCNLDSQGGAILNQEPLTVTSPPPVGDQLNFLWPGGSGTNTSSQLIDASVSAGLNLLTNGSFENFTVANTPDNWTIATGVAGTDIFKEGSIVYDGTAALKFAGGTGVNMAIKQLFGSSSGTVTTLLPDTQYAASFWIKADVVPGSGVLKLDLVDQSGAVIQDDQSVNNSLAITLSGISTTYTNHNFVFRTPRVLPPSQSLKLWASTVIPGGSNIYIDRLGMAKMNPLYPGGPYWSAFSGNTKVIKGDYWTIALGNTYGGFQKLCERLFRLRDNGLVIPFSGAPTVSDGLIL